MTEVNAVREILVLQIEKSIKGNDIWVLASLEPAFDTTVMTPSDIQVLVAEYQDIFAIPTSLPPSRAFDHRIPLILVLYQLILGPIVVLLSTKTEIENQVTTLLAAGLIMPCNTLNSYLGNLDEFQIESNENVL